ncbi:hypothetical protein PLICRDRAFT_430288 [Plicaturopsis crispa FD-325 SS-3]|uniref:Uncharacterized protein n=1 Tax=Plicaturopsis crispa FD-325 SS-3 TaxID=944288 RepID=A0A0C9SWR6_PLICR|nr:hypothetical protein PLICRDRAFT_430288 [Plicaturopsis crispa FD-325 SS-3]
MCARRWIGRSGDCPKFFHIRQFSCVARSHLVRSFSQSPTSRRLVKKSGLRLVVLVADRTTLFATLLHLFCHRRNAAFPISDPPVSL